MSNKERYKLCGFYDETYFVKKTEEEKRRNILFPWPVYQRENNNYLGFRDLTGNLVQFSNFADFRDVSEEGIIVKFDSDIEKSVGDRFIHGAWINEKIYFGEEEDIIEVLNEKREQLLKTLSTYHVFEFLKNTRSLEEYKAHLNAIINNPNGNKFWPKRDCEQMLSEIHGSRYSPFNLKLMPNKTRIEVCSIELGNITKGLEKRYLDPKYIRELQQNHPEFFA